MSSVYEPREDSALLATYVKMLARGKVLDMGTGSGVQAFAAIENSKVKEVVAVDVNEQAVQYVQHRIEVMKRENPRAGKIAVLHSNLFQAVQEEKFDTIVCNPPYLPNEEKDRDEALYGGPQGYEWSIAFLQQAKAHLAPNGQILFLFSSLTNRDRIDLELKHLGYHFEELGMLAEFFERLYVYRIWRVA